jgi:hypothetical protein
VKPIVAVLLMLAGLAGANTNPDWPIPPRTGSGVVSMVAPVAPADLLPELGLPA